MGLPKYKEILTLSTLSEIDQELFLLEKKKFELKAAKASRKKFQPHLLTHTKRRIAQLEYKKSQITT